MTIIASGTGYIEFFLTTQQKGNSRRAHISFFVASVSCVSLMIKSVLSTVPYLSINYSQIVPFFADTITSYAILIFMTS